MRSAPRNREACSPTRALASCVVDGCTLLHTLIYSPGNTFPLRHLCFRPLLPYPCPWVPAPNSLAREELSSSLELIRRGWMTVREEGKKVQNRHHSPHKREAGMRLRLLLSYLSLPPRLLLRRSSSRTPLPPHLHFINTSIAMVCCSLLALRHVMSLERVS